MAGREKDFTLEAALSHLNKEEEDDFEKFYNKITFRNKRNPILLAYGFRHLNRKRDFEEEFGGLLTVFQRDLGRDIDQKGLKKDYQRYCKLFDIINEEL